MSLVQPIPRNRGSVVGHHGEGIHKRIKVSETSVDMIGADWERCLYFRSVQSPEQNWSTGERVEL